MNKRQKKKNNRYYLYGHGKGSTTYKYYITEKFNKLTIKLEKEFKRALGN